MQAAHRLITGTVAIGLALTAGLLSSLAWPSTSNASLSHPQIEQPSARKLRAYPSDPCQSVPIRVHPCSISNPRPPAQSAPSPSSSSSDPCQSALIRVHPCSIPDPRPSAQSAPSAFHSGLLIVDLSVITGDLRITGRGDGAPAPPGVGMADQLGTALAAGDLNGDGVDDLVLAARDFAVPDVNNDNMDDAEIGRVHVLYGGGGFPLAGAHLDLLTDTLPVSFTGEADQTHLGSELAVGDVSGDGKPDLVMGARGDDDFMPPPSVFVQLGGAPLPARLDLWRDQTDVTIRSDRGTVAFAADDALAVGDVSGSNVPDIIIGDSGDDGPAGKRNNAGSVQIVHGGPFPSNVDLAVSPPNVTIHGGQANDQLGQAVTAADLNNDGKQDVIVSALGREEVYIVYGKANLPALIDLASTPPDVTISVRAYRLATGDLDGDGRVDLILGDHLASPGGRTRAGRVYILYNGAPLSATSPLTTVDAILEGTTAEANLGAALAVGDFNDDGRADLFMGAPGASPAGRQGSGAGFGLLGGPPVVGTYAVDDLADVQVLGDRAGDGLGGALALGDFDHDGRDDLAMGAPFVRLSGRPKDFDDVGEVYVVRGRDMPVRRWQRSPSPITATLYAVALEDGGRAWAVGQGGIILRYDGQRWAPVSSPTTADLRAVDVTGNGEAWAVGDQGTILHYTGGVWSQQTSPTSGLLLSIDMLSATDGWIVSLGGEIFRFDAGAWKSQGQPPNASTLASILFPGAGKGYAAGDFDIFGYDGTSWRRFPFNPPDSLTDLAFPSISDGWAVGNGGVIARFDGGKWSLITSPTEGNLSAVAFASTQEGYAVGMDGMILGYGGGQWGRAASPTRITLNDLALAPHGGGWAVGDKGVILRLGAGQLRIWLPTVHKGK